jgi:hypothetical protein
MSSYLGSGPYTCFTCKEEYDLIFADPKIYTLKNVNPEFARFDTCDSCGADEVMEGLIKHTKEGRLRYGGFHLVEKLYKALEDWCFEQRENCSNCGHERAGCQYHDG